MIYEGDIYRPPSEAYSLIVQVTVGCSHNKCTFCGQYRDKRFHIRQFNDIKRDFEEMRMYYQKVDRIFLADGDALCLSFDKLMRILDLIKELFPECKRVASYARAADGIRKSHDELIQLKEAGLGIVYIGAESGSPIVLKEMNKGEDRETLIKGTRNFEDAGIKTSVSFISGLGGRTLWREHAVKTASMINEMQASYVSLLTLLLQGYEPLCQKIEKGSFELLNPLEVLDETQLMIENINLPPDIPCVFRSNHASNYLVLKGKLPDDKELFLTQIKTARKNPGVLRKEYYRGL